MSRAGPRTSTQGAVVRPLAVTGLALGTAVAAHLLVGTPAPGPAVLTLTALVVALVVAPVLASGRSVLVTALLGQVGAHAVLATVGAGSAGGCLPALGRAARAGADLAGMGLSSGCAPGAVVVPGSAAQVALLSALTAVPLLLGHLVAAVLGAGGLERLERTAERVAAALTAALPRLPAAVAHVPEARPAVPVDRDAPVPAQDLSPRCVARRGPPAVAAA